VIAKSNKKQEQFGFRNTLSALNPAGLAMSKVEYLHRVYWNEAENCQQIRAENEYNLMTSKVLDVDEFGFIIYLP
jgi:hypothetical protein